MSSVITATGHNGTVTFDGAAVTIERRGALATISVGKGTKRIPVGSITAVQWKEPGALVNGFIQFTLSGGTERRSTFGSQTKQAAYDENSVIVTRKQAGDFQALRAAVEDAITRGTAAAPASNADELGRLAELHARGVLTDAEFAAAKAKALGI